MILSSVPTPVESRPSYRWARDNYTHLSRLTTFTFVLLALSTLEAWAKPSIQTLTSWKSHNPLQKKSWRKRYLCAFIWRSLDIGNSAFDRGLDWVGGWRSVVCSGRKLFLKLGSTTRKAVNGA